MTVESLLELEQPVLTARGEDELQRLDRVRADERESAVLDLHLSRTNVVLHDRGEHAQRVVPAPGALRVDVLDKRDARRRLPEKRVVLGNARQLDHRCLHRRGRVALATKERTDCYEGDGRRDPDAEGEKHVASRWTPLHAGPHCRHRQRSVPIGHDLRIVWR